MAHGSKKWIRDYSGRIKRSTDRTFKDKLGDVRNFDYSWTYQYGIRNGQPCSQCKGINKDIREYEKMVVRVRREEGYPRYREAYADWEKNHKKSKWNRVIVYQFAQSFNHDGFDTSKFWKEFWAEKGIAAPYGRMPLEGMLCHTCRRLYDIERASWKGPKESDRVKGWQGRMLNREYRSEVRNVLARAKFDDEVYDELSSLRPPRDSWRFD